MATMRITLEAEPIIELIWSFTLTMHRLGKSKSPTVETDGGPKARREFHVSDTNVITLTRSRPGVRY